MEMAGQGLSIRTIQYKWIFKALENPEYCSSFLKSASNCTIKFVGLFSKFVTRCLNKTSLHNHGTFLSAIQERDKYKPLITVSNHVSCFDDPGIWGSLDIKSLSYKNMRWSMAAHDVCFTTSFLSYFFMLGKCLPIIRGNGVYQDGVDFCIERLKKGEWVHIFPEGKVNVNKEFIRFKWGIGRIIYELPVTPIVVPIWHIGMDDILPNKSPYILQTRKVLTINFGDPIDLSNLLMQFKFDKTDPITARRLITEYIQKELLLLKEVTEELHHKESNKL